MKIILLLGAVLAACSVAAFSQSPVAAGKMSLRGLVIQATPEGVLVDCERKARTSGYKAVEGLVFVRGAFGTVGSEVRSHVLADGFYDYVTVTGAAARVLAFRLAGTQAVIHEAVRQPFTTAAPSAGRPKVYQNPLEAGAHSQRSSRTRNKLSNTQE